MSLYKRGNVWWSKLYRDGVPVYQSTGIKVSKPGVDAATLKREAQRKDDVWTGQLAAGSFLPRAERATYDELVEDLTRHYRNTGDRELLEVNGRLAHLNGVFSGTRASRIDAAMVSGYVEKRKIEQAASGTINRELGLLTKMLRLGLRNRKLVHVPHIDKLKEAAPRSGFFEPQQYEAVRRRLPEDLQVAVTIAYTYGWRMQSEVLSLQLAQIDLEAGTLRLEPGQTKNDDARVVYLTPELKVMLVAQFARVRSLERQLGRIVPDLFVHLRGKAPGLVGTPIRDFRKAWQTACRRAGVPGGLRHDFRRTAVRNLVNAGVPERVAMKVTGHRTRSVFDRYMIVSPADLKQATAKLAAAR
jgi:integrase